jgi:hypothetical protein
MAEFSRSFGNYPPGVTGNEPYFTGEYYCGGCGHHVRGQEFIIGNHTVCASCAAIRGECDHCGILHYADDLTLKLVPHEGDRLLCPRCLDR